MDPHTIKSDLIAMEMEMELLKYHDQEDDKVIGFEDVIISSSKTPKTSHAESLPENEAFKDHLIECATNRNQTSNNYISLAFVETIPTEGGKCKLKGFDERKLHRHKKYQASKGTANQEKAEKMISFTSLDSFKASKSIFAMDDTDDDHSFLINSKVQVIIELSSQSSHEISLQGHAVIARENEMKQVARKLDLNWSRSVIMKEVMKKNDSSCHEQISILLKPKEHDAYVRILWSPSVIKVIENYYTTGVISVFNSCSCRDLILALQYLGIQYLPRQLTYESFSCYLNFEVWSDYLSYRETIATWMKKSFVSHNQRDYHLYVTNPEPSKNESFYFHGQKCDYLDGGLHQTWTDNLKKGVANPSSSAVVHLLFAGDQNIPGKGNITQQELSLRVDQANIIREDFRELLQDELPDTKIRFTLETVISLPLNCALLRPVLRIDVGIKSGSEMATMSQEFPKSAQISLFNHLDASSLTDNSERYGEASEGDFDTQKRPDKTVDTMNAEWLLNVFLCKASTDITLAE